MWKQIIGQLIPYAFPIWLEFHPIKSKGLAFERNEYWDPVWILSSLEEEMYTSNGFFHINNVLMANALSFLDVAWSSGNGLVKDSLLYVPDM